MKNTKVTFPNKEGVTLSAKLNLPANQQTLHYVLFAHCFTCTKNLKAIHNISRSLTSLGYGVFTFDFTGLGDSEGKFKDTNFSSNIDDLIAAAEFISEKYQEPELIIGHSLGGAAAIKAAAKLPYIKGVVTIASPADAAHVLHLITPSLDEIKEKGEALTNIGGRKFKIKKQFIDDIQDHAIEETLKKLRKPLLIMHSPQDNIVGIDNAELLYKAAFHSKSFVSLDGADHLLSNKADSQYVGQLIASWAQRYIQTADQDLPETEHQTVTRIGDAEEKFTVHVKTGNHYFISDEPENAGGMDLGPSPYQLLSAALGACTAMTLRMYANHKKWNLEEVNVHLNHHKKHADDCSNCDEKSKIDHIERIIEVDGDLDEQQKKRLLEIANKCPVHRTLESKIKIESSIS